MHAKTPRYRRLVIKLSGESMAPVSGMGIDPEQLRAKAKALVELHRLGTQLYVVIGGGNYMRGNQRDLYGLSPEGADVLGMMATGMNAQALADHLNTTEKTAADVYGRGPCTRIDREYQHRDVMSSLNDDRIVILAGGLGVPNVSTDAAAVREAIAVEADCVIMSKYGTAGVYTSDPRRTVGARFLPTLTASYAIEHRLQVMDTDALSTARDAGMVIHVVPAAESNAIAQAVQGVTIGSVITPT